MGSGNQVGVLLAIVGGHWRKGCGVSSYGWYKSFVSLSRNGSLRLKVLGMADEAVESAHGFFSEYQNHWTKKVLDENSMVCGVHRMSRVRYNISLAGSSDWERLAICLKSLLKVVGLQKVSETA